MQEITEQIIMSELENQLSPSGINVYDYRFRLKPNIHANPFRTRNHQDIKGVCFHQTLGDGDVDSVHKYHIGDDNHFGKPLQSIAYTLFICDNGDIVLCNALQICPWSQGYNSREGDENKEFISIALQGNFKGEVHKSDNSPSIEQLLSSIIIWRVLKKMFNFQNNDLYGHYHFGKPACPGDSIKNLIESIRSKVDNKVGFNTRQKQYYLNALGFVCAVDGIWGKNSKKAVKDFQISNGITADGIWGKNTNAAIIYSLKLEDIPYEKI